MKTLLVHLSDIHFKENCKIGATLAKHIHEALLSEYAGVQNCIVVVSGDIAYSGTAAEYKVARSFFDELRRGLNERLKTVNFSFSPGNHDCNFSKNSQLRDKTLEGIETNINIDDFSDASIIEELCKPQEEYFDFCREMGKKIDSKISWGEEVRIEDRRVFIDVLNIAWMSRKKEKQSKLFFPIAEKKKEFRSENDLSLVVYHHPSTWLDANNARTFRQHVEENYDLIFTGHEHAGKQYAQVDFNSNDSCVYFEGGVLLENDGIRNSSFTSVLVDLEEQTFGYRNWIFDTAKKIYSPIKNDETNRSYSRTSRKSGLKTHINEDFLAHLESLDLPFTHPRIDKPKLKDLFVPIKLEFCGRLKDSEVVASVSVNELHTKVIEDKLVSLYGDSQSGKTAVLKYIYIKLMKEGYFPVLIDGALFKKPHSKEVEKVLQKEISKQYSAPSYDEINQKHNDSTVILIDNLDQIPLSESARDDVIDHLSKKYSYICTTLCTSDMAGSIVRKSDNSLISIFSSYEIKEFGYEARGDLVESWIRLGNEDSLEHEEIQELAGKREDIFNAMLRGSLLPTNPGHLLLLLQYSETGAMNPNMNGSFGHIFQALVTGTLSRVSPKYDIDLLSAYLGFFAFRIFEEKNMTLDSSEALDAHNRYLVFSDFSLDFDSITKELIRAKILKSIGGSYSFRHPYLYYYFVASHMNKIVSPNDSAQLVLRMIDSIHRDDSCNILIFYSHQANQNFVIEEVLKKIRNDFSDEDICRFSDDIKMISSFYGDLGEVVIQEEEMGTWRKDQNRSLDKNGIDNEPHNSNDGAESDPEGLGHKLNSAFRSLDVVGQILNGNVSSISTEKKLEIVQEASNLTLRIVTSFKSFIEDNVEEFASEISSKIRVDTLSTEDKKKMATKFVAYITEMVIFSILRKGISGVSGDKLTNTYKRLVDLDSTPAYKLIDFTVRLDHSGSFPFNQLKDLHKEFEKLHLGGRMLQRLVTFHFMRFHVNYDIRQKASALLKIRYSSNATQHKHSTLTNDHHKKNGGH